MITNYRFNNKSRIGGLLVVCGIVVYSLMQVEVSETNSTKESVLQASVGNSRLDGLEIESIRAPSQSDVTVIVYRPYRMTDFIFWNPKAMYKKNNGSWSSRERATLYQDSYSQFNLPAGDFEITTNHFFTDTLKLQLSPGRTYILRYDLDWFYGGFTEVPGTQSEIEFLYEKERYAEGREYKITGRRVFVNIFNGIWKIVHLVFLIFCAIVAYILHPANQDLTLISLGGRTVEIIDSITSKESMPFVFLAVVVFLSRGSE